jgi:putative ABC transport system ATP-binding protein
MTDIVLEAKDLRKTYHGSGSGVRAVDGIDLAVRSGEFVSVMGNSGSGKTTLLYLLAGLERPTSGSVQVGQKQIDQFNEKQLARLRRDTIGFVFQSMNLLPTLSLRENILIAGYLTDRVRHEVDATTGRLLEDLEIADAADRLPAQVSIGQQQRAAIGRALVNSPQMLFADEPTGSLNSSTSTEVLNALEAVSNSGKTVVMVTHDLKAACRGRRVLFIRDGRLEGEFIFDRAHGSSASDREEPLCEWLFERGW